MKKFFKRIWIYITIWNVNMNYIQDDMDKSLFMISTEEWIKSGEYKEWRLTELKNQLNILK